tara:strand:+ start:98 stop:574 length:477 start_codon:yes stop_codon:yes gene_type:complete
MEEWKDIRGYGGDYKVSNYGRVISVKFIKIKELSYGVTRGYRFVNLYNKNTRKTRYIHKLVAEYFINHEPCGYKIVVDHIDNNKINNHESNLQLITHRENSSKDRTRASKYTGVYKIKNNDKWRSQIQYKGVIKYLGCYKSEFRAHLAYQNELINLRD